MKVVFKNTVFDILISKASLYTLLFGSFLLLIVYGMGFTIGIGSPENYLDVTHYKTIIFLHIFLYIFYVSIVINSSADLEEEMRERFHEVTLLYLSRSKYFYAKYIAYLFSYLVLLMLTGVAGAVLCRVLLEVALNWKFFLGLACVGVNIMFLASILLLFSLSGFPKGSGFFAFLLYLLFSFLNSKTIINWILGSDKISEIISTIAPSVFWLQNEWLRLGVGWGFSSRFWQYLLNLSLYLILLLFFISYQMKRYECKA